MSREPRQEIGVGPVLVRGELSDAIVVAILSRNPAANVVDRGSYLRVQAPAPCVVSRLDVEAALGRPLSFPADLELVMPSFSGRLRIDSDHAEWTS